MIENFWKDKYPAGIAAEINPDQYPNILSVLKESCQRFATKPAFTNLGKTLTYGELYKLSGDFAAYLQQHTDLKPGDRIAVQLPNVLQYPIVVFGAMRAGLIVVNTNPLYTARELEHQFNDSGAKAVVCLANMAHLVEGVLPKTGVKQVIVTEVGDILPPLKRFIVNFVVKHIKKMVPAYSLPQATKLTDALARGAGKSFQEAAPQADDVAVLQYTGGTTGVPKGAMLTHANVSINAQQVTRHMPSLRPGQERVLGVLPFFHVFAMTAVMNSGIELGAELLLHPRFEIARVMQALTHERPTVLHAVPTIYNAIAAAAAAAPGRPGISTLRACISGGAPLPADVRARFERATGCKLVEGYGLTEASPVLACNPPDGVIKDGSVGIPMQGTTIEIRDLADPYSILPPGARGEIYARGPQVMRGYRNRPEETAQSFVDGALRTGDVGHLDDDGYLFVTDRLKDVILCGGYNVWPRVVEDALYQHPAVAEAIVIGVADRYRGQAPKAFVMLRPGQTATPEQLRNFLADYLSKIELPREIEIRETLPRTMIGKLSRQALVAEEQAKPAA